MGIDACLARADAGLVVRDMAHGRHTGKAEQFLYTAEVVQRSAAISSGAMTAAWFASPAKYQLTKVYMLFLAHWARTSGMPFNERQRAAVMGGAHISRLGVYCSWEAKLSITMRLTQVSGDKLFVDYTNLEAPGVDLIGAHTLAFVAIGWRAAPHRSRQWQGRRHQGVPVSTLTLAGDRRAQSSS
jgi:hypothetical protein